MVKRSGTSLFLCNFENKKQALYTMIAEWLHKLARTISPHRKIYCIPGFGTDEKIFQNLKIRRSEFVFINWLEPYPKESYIDYVERIAAPITEKNPVIIGVSFGGMVALEIARIRNVKQLILISRVKTTKELPRQWRLFGRLRLNRIMPVKAIQATDRYYALANKRIGAFTEADKAFANLYRKAINTNYMVWALDQILHWKNDKVPDNIVHIHGSDDLIFPISIVHPTHTIKGGTHMMIMNRAEEISKIINDVLKK